jgi:carbon storage regulator
MLVLSRKRLESVLIGDGIKITIIKLDRNQVRLGIEAPGHVNIAREELIRHQPEDHAESDLRAGVPAGRTPVLA